MKKRTHTKSFSLDSEYIERLWKIQCIVIGCRLNPPDAIEIQEPMIKADRLDCELIRIVSGYTVSVVVQSKRGSEHSPDFYGGRITLRLRSESEHGLSAKFSSAAR